MHICFACANFNLVGTRHAFRVGEDECFPLTVWLADWLLLYLTHLLVFSSLTQTHRRPQIIYARKVHMALISNY